VSTVGDNLHVDLRYSQLDPICRRVKWRLIDQRENRECKVQPNRDDSLIRKKVQVTQIHDPRPISSIRALAERPKECPNQQRQSELMDAS
jgi:hypothetical protein